MDTNINTLTQAINEHTKAELKYLSETTLLIGKNQFTIKGNLCTSSVLSMRFTCLKSLLRAFTEYGILQLNEEAITHILNRYRKLNNKTHEYASNS